MLTARKMALLATAMGLQMSEYDLLNIHPMNSQHPMTPQTRQCAFETVVHEHVCNDSVCHETLSPKPCAICFPRSQYFHAIFSAFLRPVHQYESNININELDS